MKPSTTLHHYVQPSAGRFLVVHKVPGTAVAHVDEDCPTLAGAEREAAWRNAEADRQARRAAEERALSGLRA